MPKLADMPRFIHHGNYKVDHQWHDLEDALENYSDRKSAQLDLDPDFQRGHVWTEAQQIAFVEFKLKGGLSGNIIFLNCAGWMRDFRGPFQLVDGKQRLTAVLKFIRNELPIFGRTISEWEDGQRELRRYQFTFYINNLEKRSEVLQWYLDLNTGGTPHTDSEITRVRKLLEVEGG